MGKKGRDGGSVFSSCIEPFSFINPDFNATKLVHTLFKCQALCITKCTYLVFCCGISDECQYFYYLNLQGDNLYTFRINCLSEQMRSICVVK